jgi:hypothetical protein
MNLLILSFVLISLTKSQNDFDKYISTEIMNNKCFDDTNVVKKKLPIYKTSPCIENLLKQIVVANRRFYDVRKNFYSLSLKKEREKEYLVIELGEYKSSRTFDYVGAIKVSRAIFLCRGDITIDTLFKLNNDKFLDVCLKKAKGSENFNYGIEPSLRGLYPECYGVNISLEVYTPAALRGYKMEERKSKKQ